MGSKRKHCQSALGIIVLKSIQPILESDLGQNKVNHLLHHHHPVSYGAPVYHNNSKNIMALPFTGEWLVTCSVLDGITQNMNIILYTSLCLDYNSMNVYFKFLCVNFLTWVGCNDPWKWLGDLPLIWNLWKRKLNHLKFNFFAGSPNISVGILHESYMSWFRRSLPVPCEQRLSALWCDHVTWWHLQLFISLMTIDSTPNSRPVVLHLPGAVTL